MGGGWGGEHQYRRGGGGSRGVVAQKPGKGITLEMYIRNTQANNKKKKSLLLDICQQFVWYQTLRKEEQI